MPPGRIRELVHDTLKFLSGGKGKISYKVGGAANKVCLVSVPIFMVPFPRNQDFISREKALQGLGKALLV